MMALLHRGIGAKVYMSQLFVTLYGTDHFILWRILGNFAD